MRQLPRGGCGQSGFSPVLLTFRKLLQSSGQKAKPQLLRRPLGAPGLGASGDLGSLGPGSEVAEETRGVGFLWGLGPRAPRTDVSGPGGSGPGRGGEGATGKARRGRGEGGPGKRGGERRAGEERGGRRERRKKEGGERRELAPRWEKGASERGGGAGLGRGAERPLGGAPSAGAHGSPRAVIPAGRASSAQLARVSRRWPRWNGGGGARVGGPVTPARARGKVGPAR